MEDLKTVGIVIGTLVFLTSIKKFFGWLKDKTETKADDNIYSVVSKVLGAFDVVLEFASANSTLLPAKVKLYVDKIVWEKSRLAEVDAAIAKAEEVSAKIAEGKAE